MKATIVEIKKLTADVSSFLFRLEDSKHFYYQAGQFVMLKAFVNGKKIERAYSIASPPPRDLVHAEYIELIIKLVPGGKLTSHLFSLKPGAAIELAGPLGKMTLKEPIQEGDIFMATGTGIAPFMSMLRKAFRDNNPKLFYLFLGVRTKEDIIYEDELYEWQKNHKNFHIIITISQPEDGWDGEVGYVQDKLVKYVKDFKNKQAYLCGLPVMVEQSKELLIELGVNSDNIYKEEY